tara:strand:+ start:13129 stop:13920 length:792 start_codon:yes stop_codon:yes gene_type:complete
MSMLKFSDLLALKKQLPLAKGVRVAAAHACGLIALEKPPTIKSHPNANEDEPCNRSMLQADYNFDYEGFIWKDAAGKEKRFCLINRLDAPTSGVLLGAFSKELSDAVRDEFAHRRVSKTYYAIVKGKPKKEEEYWVDKLSRKTGDGKLWVEPGDDFHAKTRMKWLAMDAEEGTTSLLRLMPVTGRTHQLRVQCALHGCPIVGDRRYGDFTFNRTIAKTWDLKRLFLHAKEIELNFSYEGEQVEFKASSELPLAFTTLYPSAEV